MTNGDEHAHEQARVVAAGASTVGARAAGARGAGPCAVGVIAWVVLAVASTACSSEASHGAASATPDASGNAVGSGTGVGAEGGGEAASRAGPGSASQSSGQSSGQSSTEPGASGSSAAPVDASNDAQANGDAHRLDIDASSASDSNSSHNQADVGAAATDAGAQMAADSAPPLRDGSAGSRVYPPFAPASGTVADGLAQLNAYRALVGLGPVTLDPASSSGCEAHLAYLECAAAAAGTHGYLEHTETQYPQCAVDGGAQAGIDSDLAFGESSSGRQTVGQSLGQAVDEWINGVYHRTPLLDPGLVKVGAASGQGYSCLDYAASGNTVSMRAASPVLFPPDGTTDVPDTFVGNEGPCPTQPATPATATTCPPSGFIVSANWYHWSSRSTKGISSVTSVTLSDVTAGSMVALLTWYADTIAGHDPLPGYVRDEVVLVPQSRLTPNHIFAVHIDATVSGQAVSTAWQFTTGSRSP